MWGFAGGDYENGRALDVTPYCRVGMHRRFVGSCCIMLIQAAGPPIVTSIRTASRFRKLMFAKADVYFGWLTGWIRLLTGRPRDLCSIPISSKWLLFSTLLQHRLWGPPNLLLSVYRDIFLWVKRLRSEANLSPTSSTSTTIYVFMTEP
jgi:hypothetical protein